MSLLLPETSIAVALTLLNLKHSPMHNYIVPGLTSWLISQKSDAGVVRLFVNSRTQFDHITPHSHRFDFHCLVIRGTVLNTLFHRDDKDGDEYEGSEIVYNGQPGQYDLESVGRAAWSHSSTKYKVGDWYGMTHDQIHSIEFSKDAVVMFFEGPEVTHSSVVLEPVVNGHTLRTFQVQPWMFSTDEGADFA